jgi:SNF2 family DNA or RNA helicase
VTLALREYQQIIVDYIGANKRCNLFVAMGLGKSVSTLTALDNLSFVEDVYPVLILAPLRVARSTWPEEIKKWPHLQHLTVATICGKVGDRIAAANSSANIHTCNYEQIEWLVEFWGPRWPYKTVVADEVSRLKGFRLRQGTKRAQALARVAHTKVKRFVGLTGTPCANGLQDLWGSAWFVDKGSRLGLTYDAFKQRWFQRSHTGYGVEALAHAQAEIQDKLKDICLTIKAEDWFDLKEPIITNVMVELPMQARKHYAEMEKAMFTQFGEHGVEAFGAAARTQKCLQIANGAAYLHGSNEEWVSLHDEKLQALESIVEESGGMPILVSYNFKSDLVRLKKHFPKGVELNSDPKTIKNWNAGKIPMLFAHPASAGHGLSLQDGSNIIVFFAVDWNLENHLQIIERLGPVRQMQSGYSRNVFIYRILARDTVDEMVLERLTTKREVQDILLEAMKRHKYLP